MNWQSRKMVVWGAFLAFCSTPVFADEFKTRKRLELGTQQPAAASAAPSAKPPVGHGWMIQVGAYSAERVGAYSAEQTARQRLNSVQSKASKLLANADLFVDAVEKGGMTYYRARFAGLDKDQAEAACRYLKRNDIDCVTIRESLPKDDNAAQRLEADHQHGHNTNGQ